jgi:hypothetical protein
MPMCSDGKTSARLVKHNPRASRRNAVPVQYLIAFAGKV